MLTVNRMKFITISKAQYKNDSLEYGWCLLHVKHPHNGTNNYIDETQCKVCIVLLIMNLNLGTQQVCHKNQTR